VNKRKAKEKIETDFFVAKKGSTMARRKKAEGA